MNCRHARDIALLRDSGEASPEEIAELEAHLRDCPECRDEIDAEAAALSALRAARRPVDPPERVREAVVGAASAPERGRSRILYVFAAAAAAAVVILAALPLIDGDPVVEGDPSPAPIFSAADDTDETASAHAELAEDLLLADPLFGDAPDAEYAAADAEDMKAFFEAVETDLERTVFSFDIDA